MEELKSFWREFGATAVVLLWLMGRVERILNKIVDHLEERGKENAVIREYILEEKARRRLTTHGDIS